MAGQNKTKLLGWHPGSAENGEWARAEAARRGVPLARVLDEALAQYRARCEQQAGQQEPVRGCGA